MPQKVEHSRLLGGGLMLIPPASAVPAPYAVHSQNWRVDRAGAIKTRRGTLSDGSAGGVINAIYRVGNNRYGSVDGNLKLGAGLGTTVDSGFSGRPPGMCSAFDWLYVMDTAKQRKVEGSNAYNWGIAAPATAVTAAEGAATSVLVSEFDAADAWVCAHVAGNVETVEPAGAKTYDTSNKINGSASTHMECNPIGQWILRKDFAATDYGFAGLEEDTDIFYFWLYLSNPQSVASITVTAYNGTGADRNSVYCTFPQTALNPGTFTWTPMAIHRRLDAAKVVSSNPEYQKLLQRMAEAEAAGNSVDFEASVTAAGNLSRDILERTPAFRGSTAAAAEFDWSAVTGFSFAFDIIEACDVHLDLAEFYGARGTMSGEFTFFTTFANDQDEQSNPSPGSEAIIVQNRKIDLTSIPTSADPQVTFVHIYGIGGALEAPKRFKTVAAGTTSTTIDVSIDTVQDLNIDMPVDNDPPPAARGCIEFGGRVIVFNSPAHPSRTWWSPVGRPGSFPGADGEIGNWRDNGDSDEQILAATKHGQRLMLYKERSVWRVIGDIETARPERAAAAVAPVGAKAVAPGPGYDVLCTEEGVGIFTGDSYRDLSAAIRPIFQGEKTDIPGGITLEGWNRAAASSSCIAYSNGRIYFSYPEGAATAPTVTVVYDEQSGVWSLYRIAAGPGGFTALYHEGTGNGLVGGYNGSVLELEIGASDAGPADIPVLYQSPSLDMGYPDRDKRLSEIAVEYRTAEPSQDPAALTLSVIDQAGTVTAVGSLSSATTTRSVFQLGANGDGLLMRRAAYRLDGNVSATCTVEAVDLYWTLDPRARLTLDSELLSFCYLQSLEGFEVRLSSSGPVSWAVEVDTVGTLVQVATGTLTSTSGARALRPISLSGINGKTFRLRMWSTGLFKLWSVKAKVREIGETVDGTNGGFWETTDGALGDLHEKAWLWRRFSLHADTTGAMNLKWYTDSHGRAVTLRDTDVVNTEITTVGQRTIEGEFPGTMKGFLKRVRMDGANFAQLLGLKVYVKPMGWGDGLWRWVDVPGIRKGANNCMEVGVVDG